MAMKMNGYPNPNLSTSDSPSTILDTSSNGGATFTGTMVDHVETTPAPITSTELSIVNFTIGTIGIADNLFVIIIILSSTVLRKQLNMFFILNQSVIDLTIAVLLIATTCIRTYEIPPGSHLGGELLCRLWLNKVPLWGMMVVSTYNLIALTIERYLAMMHPVWHKVHFNSKMAAAMMVSSWFIGLSYNYGYMVPSSIIVDGNCQVYVYWPSETFRSVFGVVTAIVLFFIPLITLIYCYSRIAIMLRKRVKVAPEAPADHSATGSIVMTQASQGQEDRWSKAHRNTIKTLALVSCCFGICWIWNQMYFMLMNLGIPEDFTSNFYHFTVIAIFINCCINPIIYSLKYDQFKKEARRLLFKKATSLSDQSSSTATTST